MSKENEPERGRAKEISGELLLLPWGMLTPKVHARKANQCRLKRQNLVVCLKCVCHAWGWGRSALICYYYPSSSTQRSTTANTWQTAVTKSRPCWNARKCHIWGRRDGSSDKGTYHQAWHSSVIPRTHKMDSWGCPRTCQHLHIRPQTQINNWF